MLGAAELVGSIPTDTFSSTRNGGGQALNHSVDKAGRVLKKGSDEGDSKRKFRVA